MQPQMRIEVPTDRLKSKLLKRPLKRSLSGVRQHPLATPAWRTEMLYDDGDEFFEALCADIDRADQSIDLESYIFDQDALGKRVLDRLAKAATRGVRVRVLLDGAGASQWTASDSQKCLMNGVHVRFFHPMPWQRHHFKIWKFLTLRKLTLGFYKLNHRNHRKCCTIDGKIAFVGSMNVSARHLKSMSGKDAWRDTSVRVEGEPIVALQQAFNAAWSFSYDYFHTLRRNMKLLSPIYWIRLNNSEAQGKLYRNHLLGLLNGAKKRIWITNPYFVPDRKLTQALRAAAKRGVDVRLLLPDKTDFKPGKYASHSFFEILLKDGVKIYEYLPSMLHAKVLIVDDLATVGSSNLNYRSIYQDLEADVILNDRENIDKLTARFLVDLSESREIKLTEWRTRAWIRRFLERIFLLFKGIL